MKHLTIGVYVLFGAASIIAGIAAILAPSLILPGSDRSRLSAHLIQEEGAAFVFLGLMFLWCLRHFDQRRPVHLALLLFTGLLAAIHWAGYLHEPGLVRSALVNTVPVLILAITAPAGWYRTR